LIDDGATVQTSGKGKTTTISIGAAPRKGTVGQTPAGVTIDEDGGTVYFGQAGGVVAQSVADVIAKNQDVIFNNASTNIATNKITLGDNATVIADPPTKTVSTVPFVIPSTIELSSQPTVSATSNGSAQVAVNNGLTSTFDASQITNQLATVDNANGWTETANANGARTLSRSLSGGITMRGADEVIDNADDMLVSAAFHTGKEAGLNEFSVDNSKVDMTESTDASVQQLPNSKRFVLKQGNVVFAPFQDTTIETAHGSVKIAANSVALVMESTNGLAVYNINDSKKNSVVINTQGNQLTLSPGRHALVSSHAEFVDGNAVELVQHRNLSRVTLSNGMRVFTTEFSIPSACYAVKPLKQLMSSKHAEASKMAKGILKTTAVIMTLSPDRGDFVQFFKPRTTAMK
jgi:hypothetical protein